MAHEDINKKPFDEGTQLKLNIFRECFREWLPVFLLNPHIKTIFIYDMFAGSGYDSEGEYGSPLILLDEARGFRDGEYKYCNLLQTRSKGGVVFGFNEGVTKKAKELKANVSEFFNDCEQTCQFNECVLKKSCYFRNDDFQIIRQNNEYQKILNNNQYAKFILLDQYGFKEIDDDTFIELIDAPKTDFIFFIASSFIKRFATLPAVTNYFRKRRITFDESNANECHKVITDYFKSLIPQGKEYYLHNFTIKKGSNYFGLIFGSNHTLGMEKFLRVCWRFDAKAGESNCNTFNDYEEGTLFYQKEHSNKKKLVCEEIQELILSRQITNNIDGLKYVLSRGCEPRLFVHVISQLITDKKIEKPASFNRQAANIHKVSKYNIVLT